MIEFRKAQIQETIDEISSIEQKYSELLKKLDDFNAQIQSVSNI